ncbi:MAG: fibronectin type III domain-containing protein, partial [Acidobacteria bacterium]|nr:fibronectin type III domain-containing protein [Acidobacteriota bacterium]
MTLKKNSFIRHASLFTLLALLVGFNASCGKRRPPLPPVERVPQRTELLSGIQRGNQVILSFPVLARNASNESVQSIRRIDVYRLAEAINDPLPLTEEEFSARSTLVGSVPYESIQRASAAINYVDELSLTQSVRLRYSVRFVNAAGQRAAFSNFLLIEPTAGISQPPVLSAQPDLKESSITIRWTTPTANVDESKPPNLLGYNVYRTTGAQNEPAQTPLNSSPLTVTQYSDQAFEFGTEYLYIVRAVSLGAGGLPVESLNSNAVTAAPQDIFAPTPPTGITAATSTGAPARISIFFAANPERDVAGYYVYR